MKKLIAVLGGVVFSMVIAAGDAKALVFPTSSCSVPGFAAAVPGSPSFTCNLFASDGSGNFAGSTQVAFAPGTGSLITPGYLVILKSGPTPDPINGLAADLNTGDWLQVVEFFNNVLSQHITLTTLGCSTGFGSGDSSCFSALLTPITDGVNNGSPVVFFDAATAGQAVYQYDGSYPAGRQIYNVVYGTPEPGTLGLLGFGLAGAFLARRRRSSL